MKSSNNNKEGEDDFNMDNCTIKNFPYQESCS